MVKGSPVGKQLPRQVLYQFGLQKVLRDHKSWSRRSQITFQRIVFVNIIDVMLRLYARKNYGIMEDYHNVPERHQGLAISDRVGFTAVKPREPIL